MSQHHRGGVVLTTVIVVVVFLVLAGIVAWYLVHDRGAQPPKPLPTEIRADSGAREARRSAIADHEDELMQRRVTLESRRGPLGGDDQVYDRFVELEQRLRAGEIDEAEFEREKIRLLGG